MCYCVLVPLVLICCLLLFYSVVRLYPSSQPPGPATPGREQITSRSITHVPITPGGQSGYEQDVRAQCCHDHRPFTFPSEVRY